MAPYNDDGDSPELGHSVPHPPQPDRLVGPHSTDVRVHFPFRSEPFYIWTVSPSGA